MKRSIIITDLTRFSAGKPTVCIAGIDPKTGECIRPMPYLPFIECERLKMLPGGILVGDFTPTPDRTAPHLEDSRHKDLKFGGACSSAEFRQVLDGSCFASLEEGFECGFESGERLLPPDQKVQRSIITLQVQPTDIEIVENTYKPGGIQLNFTDGSGRRRRFFPITDLGFYDYAQRHRESGALDALNEQIAKQETVYLRIGLTRLWRNPNGKEGFWMQANGIYTFPTVLRYIRSYPEKAPTKS